MEALTNIAVIVGVASVALLWAFSLGGAIATVWETLSDHVIAIADKLKG